MMRDEIRRTNKEGQSLGQQQQQQPPRTYAQQQGMLTGEDSEVRRWERWAAGLSENRQPQFTPTLPAAYPSPAHAAEMNALHQMRYREKEIPSTGAVNEVRILREQIVQARSRMLGESNPVMFEHLQCLVTRLQSQVAVYETRYF